MRELLEYREKLLARLSEAATEFRLACLAVPNRESPVVPGGWSVHQIAAHTRDVEKLVYGERARRTLQEDNPAFPNFDGEAYMSQHYSPSEPLSSLLDGFVDDVRSLVAMLQAMPQDSWPRESSHETQGVGITLQAWVERGLEHIEEHLVTVRHMT